MGLRIFVIAIFCLSLPACTVENNDTSSKKASAQPFVEFSLAAMEGQPRQLLDYRGKLLLINFWATWCAPCVSELPSLQRLSESLSGEDFQVVSINVDASSSLPDVKRLAKELGLSFDILLDNQLSLPPKLGITGFPETFFVDKQGNMVEFYDPIEKKNSIRIISDRDWNSTEIKNSIKALLLK